MSSNGSDTHSNDSCPSDFNSDLDAILANIDFEFENRSRRSTPESHWGCPGSGHRQGAPVFSCGCYKHNVVGRFEPEPELPDNEQAFQLADELQLGAEQYEQPETLKASSRERDLEDADECHPNLKRKRSEDDNTPCNFGHDNMRAASVPITNSELSPKQCRKILLKGELLAKVMKEVVGVHHAMSKMIEAIVRQSMVLHEVCNAIEDHGM
ncbi:hypothetical protein BDR07DRAFT_1482638 [Suillus spraguei]|nr:hypothetical protein BDR07DRAFT_1490320 [Suillus spraguei]KAG2364360.1 hypothetical protein BDR07DRAFT_1482638 [Suillus spraguei]